MNPSPFTLWLNFQLRYRTPVCKISCNVTASCKVHAFEEKIFQKGLRKWRSLHPFMGELMLRFIILFKIQCLYSLLSLAADLIRAATFLRWCFRVKEDSKEFQVLSKVYPIIPIVPPRIFSQEIPRPHILVSVTLVLVIPLLSWTSFSKTGWGTFSLQPESSLPHRAVLPLGATQSVKLYNFVSWVPKRSPHPCKQPRFSRTIYVYQDYWFNYM